MHHALAVANVAADACMTIARHELLRRGDVGGKLRGGPSIKAVAIAKGDVGCRDCAPSVASRAASSVCVQRSNHASTHDAAPEVHQIRDRIGEERQLKAPALHVLDRAQTAIRELVVQV
jgi:hypothetical protein